MAKELDKKKSVKKKNIVKKSVKKNDVTEEMIAAKKDKKKADIKKGINIKKYLTKANITYFGLLVLDIVFVIWLAKKNIVNYVTIFDDKIFVSKTRYLLWGRNYVNVIAIIFFWGYICLINKFFLHKKNTKKFVIGLFIGLVVLNVLLFILFTKRVY